MIEVFCTRTLHETAYEGALQKGIKITSDEFIRISPVYSGKIREAIHKELDIPNPTLLFTSKNAVQIALEHYLSSISKAHMSSWNIYCLSGATKKALLTRFRKDQIVAYADHAAGLIPHIAAYKETDPIHFFCGNRRRNTLPVFMKNHFIPYKEWVIYQTLNTARSVSQNYQAYLFYSPSAVESFFSLNNIKKDIPCFSIGQTTTRALEATIKNRVYTSERPDTDHLLQTLFHYFKTEI